MTDRLVVEYWGTRNGENICERMDIQGKIKTKELGIEITIDKTGEVRFYPHNSYVYYTLNYNKPKTDTLKTDGTPNIDKKEVAEIPKPSPKKERIIKSDTSTITIRE